ncbi:MAG: cytochrome P450 [Chloroflexi bacterium]|nr:MAG: cytochrome P450 [Chloroflexota bacterium]TML42583.1 MAG: cytochrome P450 [Actinomycetota bacterium]
MEPPQNLTVDEIDLSDDKFWGLPIDQRDGAFKTLREQRPLAHYEEPDVAGYEEFVTKGDGYYAVTRHADILACSRQPEIFSSAKGIAGALDQPEMFTEFFGSMIAMDDPRHGRLRRIVAAGFTPRMLKQLEDQVQVAASQIVDDVAPTGECDFVTEVAAKLPLKIICDMMGVPKSDYDTVFTRSNIILGAGDPEYAPEGGNIAMALLSAGAELAQMMAELGQYRREHPSDDLTSALVNASVDGEGLSDAELGSFFILLVVAGNETTRNAISSALEELTRHPDQRAIWMEDFEGLAPSAVEEIVRWATPVNHMRRTALKDSDVNGHPVKQGDKFLMFYRSANRDEAVFENPYSFDLGRSPNDHVGFGGPGPHFCLGAHLARREITVMYRELFRRLPDIEMSGEPDRLLSNFINGIKHLPCTFTPRDRTT